MDNYEDDDDTHYCIKCHLTLSGLENYIRHRQTDCRTIDTKNDITTESSITTELSELSANFFFNSLQLQMCTKTKTTCDNRMTNELDKKLINENDDKRGNKKQQKKYNDDMTSDTLQSVVNDLEGLSDHIAIPSLVGFPDIVNFNDTNKTTTITTTTTTSSSTVSSKFVPSTSLKTNDKKRNDDHRGWLDDTFEDIDVNKEPIKVNFNSYDTDEDDDTDDETSDDDDDDDDQDTYSDSDEQDEQEYSQQRHTGGKWKPGQLLHHITPTNDDDDTEDYRPDSPPSHTGGKWKPSEKIEEDDQQHDQDDDEDEDDDDRENEKNEIEQEQQHELENDNYDDEEDDDEDDDDDEYKNTLISKNQLPPPGHTRGKWIPGTSIGPTETNITDNGYWCSPCGRKLASKLLYNRHLRSDLHTRRSIQEIEGDIKLPKSIGTLLQSKRRSKRQQLLEIKNEAEKNDNIIDKQTKKKRQRDKIVLHCEICHARVRRPQLGKHLLSHYHCRIAGLNPCSQKAQNFILENMNYVVRQCPFQCSSCRFYCNTEDTFLLHWRSKLHCDSQDDDGYHYLCACCNFWCETNELMEKHMISIEHRNAVIMINGSVPIVIGKQRILSCDTCYRRFRYNFQLRIHAKDTGHFVSTTASDDYQQIITCNICCQIFRSQVALQRHQLSLHIINNSTDDKITKPYFCSFCSLNFETPQDAIIHRRTPAHKQIVKEHKLPTKELLQKTCKHCNNILENLKTYKRHLLQYHRDFCHSCPRCGMVFALHQEITKHTKNFECQENLKQSEYLDNNDKKWKCKSCSFSVNSHSEYLFHQALHGGIIQTTTQQPSSSKIIGKYCCPVCDKLLPKESLRNHIRTHTGEKPFTCQKCYQSFVMRSTFNAHNKICQVINLINKEDSKERQRNYICSECSAAFYTKHSLRQHMLRHDGKNYKCKYPDCPTYLRTENELKTHLTIVHETDTVDKKYQCNKCSYAGKTKAQLRRHEVKHEESTDEGQLSCQYEHCMFVTKTMSHLQRHIRTHTGKKPYKCRHCTYASNNLENLRKHILSTKLHPGKMIYECDTCHKNNIANFFCTNFSKNLRSHLVESHPQEFPTPDHASRYVSSLFDDKN